MRSLVVLVAFLVGCAHFDPRKTETFHQLDGEPRYFVYVPKDWSPDRAWPVVLYLHGAGEWGRDLVAPTQSGLALHAEESHGTFPAIVVIPQAPPRTFWGMPENNIRALRALDEAMVKWHGDPSRVYLTGNSLGGYGTYFMGAAYPERFAALVPICGGVRGKAPSADAPFADVPDDRRADVVAEKIGKVPVWIFHGKKDWVVPVASSREMNAALQKAGGEVHYTEYGDLGHHSWDRAYADPQLWAWVLSKRRSQSDASK
jgi:predicted peptidase